MTYLEIQEKLILSIENKVNHSFLEIEFPYKASYELLNIAIINTAKKGEKHINFDFIDYNLNKIMDKTLAEVERDSRRIYPSYGSWADAIYHTFNYPRYLAARGFNVEIRDALKSHGYASQSYHITW